MAGNSNDRLEALEMRQTFTDDQVQKLEDALDYSTRKVLELEQQVARLLKRLESLEQSSEDDQETHDDGPPPHY